MQSGLERARREVKKKMFGYIAAGLGLVAGLAWNDAIKLAIDYFIPSAGSTLVAKILYAIIITVVVGLALFYIEKSLEEESAK